MATHKTSRDREAESSAPWWANETPVRVSCLPDILPRRDDGKKVSKATAFRLTLHGVGGVRMRRFRGAGNAWATTVEEVHRWQHCLTEAAGGDA